MNTNGLLRNSVENQDLSFDKTVFKKDNFSVDSFLQEYSNKGFLETMRDDLGLYLKILRSEMIELINYDYKDFVHLSSNLIGLDKSISEIQTPLGQLKEEVLQVKITLDEEINNVTKHLEQRQQIRLKQQCLQNLEKMQISLFKLSNIIAFEGEQKFLNPDTIERAASEFNQLQFNMSTCEGFLSSVHKQNAAKLSSLLAASVDTMFMQSLKAHDLDLIARCLRIYVGLGRVSDAENLFHKEVVVPGLNEIINANSVETNPDSLNAIYNNLLAFVDNEMKDLLELTIYGTRSPIIKDYNFIVNSFWLEAEKRLELYLSSIYAPGNPDVFYQNYQNSIKFICGLAYRCKTWDIAKQFVSHPRYKLFLQRFNLPVYFQIRFQEIAGMVETALSGYGQLLHISTFTNKSEFRLPATIIVWDSVLKCWSDGIFIREIAHRFWKLCMQILSRYCNWIEEIVRKDWNVGYIYTAEFISHHPQKDKLSYLMILSSDAANLTEKLELFKHIVIEKVGPVSLNCLQIITNNLHECVENMKLPCSKVETFIIRELTREGLNYLRQVNDIPRLYRRTNRDVPTNPCPYVAYVLREPVKYYKMYQDSIHHVLMSKWFTAAFCITTSQYFVAVNDVLNSIKKTEESLRRLKKIRDKAETSNELPGMDDNEKMKYQLTLDVNAYWQQIQQLGFAVDDIEKMGDLLHLVRNNYQN